MRLNGHKCDQERMDIERVRSHAAAGTPAVLAYRFRSV